MRFAHLADCHIGGWREPKLKDLGLKSFEAAINVALHEKVEFILISGDLFDNALPSLDLVKDVTGILKVLAEKNIRVYIIPGSHDYSVSGKTMIDVFEKAGLVKNVMRFEGDKFILSQDRINLIVAGIGGKRGGLEIEDYKKLKLDATQLSGFKIFMFHSLLNELKPKSLELVESMPGNLLPRGFNYYAGGHPHFVCTKQTPAGIIAYPGPTFPNNFKELSELKCGSFNIVNVEAKVDVRNVLLDLVPVLNYDIDANGRTPLDIEDELMSIDKFDNKILLIRISGLLKKGKPSDIRFRDIEKRFKNAYIILKNISGLSSEENTSVVMEVPEVQDQFMKDFMDVLNLEKNEGERNNDFEQRVLSIASKYLGVEL